MPDLSNLEIQAATVATYPGIIVQASGALAVNVNGNILPVRWADPVVVTPGDAVLVELSSGPTGQGQAFVKCRLSSAPRPAQAKVKSSSPGASTIVVTGSDGGDYTALFVSSYTPAAGDSVVLSWSATLPTVLGKVGTVPTNGSTSPGGGVAPPPVTTGSGTSGYVASDSATWNGSFGWDSWAGGSGNVYQGSYGGPQLYGAWFYAGSPGELAGRTLTRIQFRLGPRRTVGNYNAPTTVHFYAHTNPTRPGGDVTRTAGPFDVTIAPGWAGGTIDLPLAFAPALQAGGGIAITGDPYAGFLGRNSAPDSGALTIDWTR